MAVKLTYHGSPSASSILQEGFRPGRMISVAPGQVFSTPNINFASGYGNPVRIATPTNTFSLPSVNLSSGQIGREVIQSPQSATRGMRLAQMAERLKNVSPTAARLLGGETISGIGGSTLGRNILSRTLGSLLGGSITGSAGILASPYIALANQLYGPNVEKADEFAGMYGEAMPEDMYEEYSSYLGKQDSESLPSDLPMYDEFPTGFSFRPQETTLDTSRFADVDLEPGYLDRAGSYGQDVYSEEPTSLKGKTLQGIEKLMSYLPFGENSITGRLISALPQESPEIKSMKNFYRSQYGLTPTGQVASGIMAGYNPVYGGALNMLTGGRFGTPTQFGLANAARQRIENIAKRKAAQTAASRAKIAELQRFAEADTISRARQAAPDVYKDAGNKGTLGPGGGFSTSGKEGAFSSKSGRGRQDF